MRIKLLYFSTAADLSGTTEESLDLARPCDVAGLWDSVLTRHPQLGPLRASCRVARNREFVENDRTELDDGDEIAFLPPFSGG